MQTLQGLVLRVSGLRVEQLRIKVWECMKVFAIQVAMSSVMTRTGTASAVASSVASSP